MEIGLMIEGQDGLNWERWKRLLEAAERLGYVCVHRSDHFTNTQEPDKDSLELWVSLTYAADHTQRVEFGPLVTPVTFRHPAITARMAAAVDDLSGGRLVLGMGAGWQDREHRLFGVPFPPTPVRYEMLEDYLEVVTRLLRSDEPVHYEGKHFRLEQAVLLPRPQRPGGPRILVGGNGMRRTLPLAARYAEEWNAVFPSPDELQRLMKRMDELLEEEGRNVDSVKRSLMIGAAFSRTEGGIEEKVAMFGTTRADAAQEGVLAGTVPMWVDQLQGYAEAGVQRVMLQWLEQDNIEDLEVIAQEVLPQVT